MKKTYSQEEQQRHIELWKASGLSQRAYCEHHGVPWTSFKNWQRKRPDERVSFAPVELSHDVTPTWLIEAADGWRIHVPMNANVESLSRLFNALKVVYAS